MTGFFWIDGHLGWGIFSLLVFSGLWLMGADLFWRLKDTQRTRFAVVAGWIAGSALIVLGYWLVGR